MVVAGPNENPFAAGADVAVALLVVAAPVSAAGVELPPPRLRPPNSGLDAGSGVVCAGAAEVCVEDGPNENAGFAAGAGSVVVAAAVAGAAGFEKRLVLLSFAGAAPNNEGAVPGAAGCAVAGVGAVGAAAEGPKENAGLGASEVVVDAGVEDGVVSAGFGAPKLKPPVAGLDPNRPLEGAADAGAGADGPLAGASGFVKLNGVLAVPSAGFAPKRPLPPVLAPNVEPEGGGPAGVVDGLPKLKALFVPPVAGVVDPNNEGALVDGVDVLSGVPNEKVGFAPSPPWASSGFLAPKRPPDEGALPELAPKRPDAAGLLSVEPVAPKRLGAAVPEAGCCPPKLKPVVLVPDVPLPKSPPPLAGLFAVPNNDCPLAPPDEAGGLKLNAISKIANRGGISTTRRGCAVSHRR